MLTHTNSAFAGITLAEGTLVAAGNIPTNGAQRGLGNNTTLVVASAYSRPLGTGRLVASDSTVSHTIRTPDTTERQLDNAVHLHKGRTTIFDGPGNLRINGIVSTFNTIALGETRTFDVRLPRLILAGKLQSTQDTHLWRKLGDGIIEVAGTGESVPYWQVSAGTLLVNGTILASNLTTRTVKVDAAGAVLAGTGTIERATTIGTNAVLAPGNLTNGTLNVRALTMQNQAIYEWEIASDGCDSVNVTTGPLTFGANATLRLTGHKGALVRPGDQHVLFAYEGAHPTLPNWTFEFLGEQWTGTNAVVTLDTDNRQVVLGNIAIQRRGTVFLFQ